MSRERASRILLLIALPLLLAAAEADRDFSGDWILDTGRSELGSLGEVENHLTVSQGGGGILCSDGKVKWSYALDGSETSKQVGEDRRASVTKWEGSALLVNTQVSGPRSYTVMDRWELARSHNTLTITRQIVDLHGETEGKLVFVRANATLPPPTPAQPDTPTPADPNAPPPPAGWRQSDTPAPAPPTLATRTPPGAPPDITVPTGTHVLLSLTGELSTKHAKDGDHVYLRTASPVAINGHVVIPRGSDVEGTVTHAKPAGKVVGKGELYIRFDSLVLPNGVARDFRARPPGEEGKVDGNTKTADGRTVIEGAGAGAAVGAITHGLGGAAVGGGIGALAGVLLSRNQDVVLRSGTHIEMVLDRDLVFHPDELP